MKDAKSVASFHPSCQFRDGQIYFQNASLQSRFFRDKFLPGIVHVGTLVSEKAECLLAIGKDKNVSFLE